MCCEGKRCLKVLATHFPYELAFWHETTCILKEAVRSKKGAAAEGEATVPRHVSSTYMESKMVALLGEGAAGALRASGSDARVVDTTGVTLAA